MPRGWFGRARILFALDANFELSISCIDFATESPLRTDWCIPELDGRDGRDGHPLRELNLVCDAVGSSFTQDSRPKLRLAVETAAADDTGFGVRARVDDALRNCCSRRFCEAAWLGELANDELATSGFLRFKLVRRNHSSLGCRFLLC